MGFIFQPGTTRAPTHEVVSRLARLDPPTSNQTTVTCAALEALAIGDAASLERLFTEDVAFRSPHVEVRSRSELVRSVGQPESALGELDVTLTTFVVDEPEIAAEWRIEASLVGPVLFGDNVLIEPVPDRLVLDGAVFARFTDGRISAFRCYFDDSEMLDGAPTWRAPLRLTARWDGAHEAGDGR